MFPSRSFVARPPDVASKCTRQRRGELASSRHLVDEPRTFCPKIKQLVERFESDLAINSTIFVRSYIKSFDSPESANLPGFLPRETYPDRDQLRIRSLELTLRISSPTIPSQPPGTSEFSIPYLPSFTIRNSSKRKEGNLTCMLNFLSSILRIVKLSFKQWGFLLVLVWIERKKVLELLRAG